MVSAIELQNISVRYCENQKPILENISLNVEQGEFIVLCGSSGCGKTTVTRIINGLIPEFYSVYELKGEIKIFGNSIQGKTISEIGMNVGTVFQNPKSQFFNLDTSNELAFGCENLNLNRSEILSRVKKTVTDMDLESLINRDIFELSGGEKQRIACGSIISMHPEILVMDEPTSNLDRDSIEKLKLILLNLKSSGFTIVLSEHRLYWLKDLADRFIYLREGRISEIYSFDEIYNKTEEEFSKLGLRSMDMSGPHERLENIIRGKSWELCKISNKTPKENAAQLILEDLSVSYEKNKILNIPKLKFEGGSIVGVIGPNGAGKSTLANVILGFLNCKGIIKWNEEKLDKKKLNKKGFMVMQDVNQQLFSNTLIDEVLLGADASKEEAETVLKKLGLGSLESRHPASLSGGEKQRAAVASALLSNKEIIVFDEPTSGLDRESLESFCAEIKKISSEENIIFVITHDMEVVFQLVDYILPCTKYEGDQDV